MQLLLERNVKVTNFVDVHFEVEDANLRNQIAIHQVGNLWMRDNRVQQCIFQPRADCRDFLGFELLEVFDELAQLNELVGVGFAVSAAAVREGLDQRFQLCLGF